MEQCVAQTPCPDREAGLGRRSHCFDDIYKMKKIHLFGPVLDDVPLGVPYNVKHVAEKNFFLVVTRMVYDDVVSIVKFELMCR